MDKTKKNSDEYLKDNPISGNFNNSRYLFCSLYKTISEHIQFTLAVLSIFYKKY